MKKLSIIIPAKDEEKRIAKTLSNYASFFSSKKDIKLEIIVVINNTTDATSEIVSDYSVKYPFIKKIITPYKLGKGGAVALGFKNSTGEYVGFTDADGAVTASEYYKLFEFLEETPWLDGALGSRKMEKTVMSFRRRLLSNVFNLYEKLLFNLPYKDTQCGAKLFRRNAALSIASRMSSTGWALDVNLLLVARYLNLQLLEFPVVWNEKDGSKFSVYTGFIGVLLEFIKLKRLDVGHKFEVNTPEFIRSMFRKKISSEEKNIVIFAWRDIKHTDAGGSEVYVHNIAKRLAKNNSVTLFTSRPGNLNDKDYLDDVKIIRRGNFITVYIWAFIYYVLYFRNTADFIIDVENGIPFFTPLYSRKPKLMILHHVHKGQWFKQFPFPIAIVGFLIESFVMPLVYLRVPVITVSPSSMNELKKINFIDQRIYLAYNSISTKVGGKYKKSPTPLIAYIGRVKAYKRIEIAVKSLKSLLGEFPDLKLIIGGSGDNLDNLRKLVKKLNIENSVEILGFVSEKEKWKIFQKAWVFVMPSMKEGWGITIVEAASCGTPAVGFNVSGVKDSIRDNLTGILVNKESEYTQALRDLIKKDKLRNKLGDNAIKWSHYFTWGSAVKIFDQVIDATIKSHGLMSDKVFPWDLDFSSEVITSLYDK